MASTATRGLFELPVRLRSGGWEVVAKWLLLLGTAITLGYVVGTGHWVYALLLLVVPVVLKYPVQFALAPFAFLIPFDAISALGGQKQGISLEWFAGAAGTFILIMTALAGHRLRTPPKAALWWSLLLFWLVSTGAWAVDPTLSISRLPTAFGLLLLYLAASSITITRKELLTIMGFAICGATLAAAYSAISYYQGSAYHANVEGLRSSMRASLVIGDRETDPNGFATTMLLPISFCIATFLRFRGWIRFLALSAFSVMLFAVFLSMSRGTLVAIVVMAAVFFLRMRLDWRAVFLAILGTGLTLAMPGIFFERLQSAVATGGSGRFDIWKIGWECLKRYGFFGAGLDNFPTVYNMFAGAASHFIGYNKVAHNTFLTVAVEGGIVALLLFLYVLKIQLRGTRVFNKQVFPVTACEAGCWAMLAAGFFLNVLWGKTFWFAWIMLAMASQLTEAPATETVG